MKTLARLQADRTGKNRLVSAPTEASVAIETTKRAYGEHAVTLYESTRSIFSIHPVDKNGAVGGDTIESYKELIIHSISEGLRDRVQMMLNPGINSLFSFGEEHKIVTISASIIDSKTGILTRAESGELSRASIENRFKRWKDFYARAAVSDCAKNRNMVALMYANRVLYGGLVSHTSSISADNPLQIALNITMYVSHSVVIT